MVYTRVYWAAVYKSPEGPIYWFTYLFLLYLISQGMLERPQYTMPKRQLVLCQKRPKTQAKETYYHWHTWETPIHHAEAAVGPQLNVPTDGPDGMPKARIELRAPKHIEYEVARVSCVLGGRGEAALEVEPHAQQQRRHVEKCKHPRRVCVCVCVCVCVWALV